MEKNTARIFAAYTISVNYTTTNYYNLYILTCGRTPSIFSDGGTLRTDGTVTWPKSTVNASHHIPKWPMSNMVRSPGNVRTMVLRSYRRKGTSFPFSSATLMPCGVGLSPAPTQNLASKIKSLWSKLTFINCTWYLFIFHFLATNKYNKIMYFNSENNFS